jgi:hypothetical protein
MSQQEASTKVDSIQDDLPKNNSSFLQQVTDINASAHGQIEQEQKNATFENATRTPTEDTALQARSDTTIRSQVWQLHDPSSSSSSSKLTSSGSPGSSQFLNPPNHPQHHYHQSSASISHSMNSSKSPLPTSPSQRSIEKAIAQKFASLGMPPERSAWRIRLDQFVLNEGARVIFLSFWSLLQVLIFYFSFEIYNRSTHYSQARSNLGITLGVSRGAAAVINFDCGLILFSVCRNLISLLRSTFLNNIVPFDKNILFHKTVAWSIVLFSVVHSVGHYINYYRLEQAQRQKEGGEVNTSAQYMALFTGPGFTGHVLVLILFLMVTSSVGKIPYLPQLFFNLFLIFLQPHATPLTKQTNKQTNKKYPQI